MKTYTILIADDLPENLQIIAEALKDSNIEHKIIRAINGKILCELAEKRIPDLIITDWEMPEMNGIEAIKYLKQNEETKDIPIIMCTGIMTTSENLKTAIDCGAVDYIRKPIDNIELQSRVYSMLKLSDSYKTIKDQNIILEQQKIEIQNQRDDLKTLNATKDKFFNIIAHDLRNPFNSLLGFSDLLVSKIESYDIEKSIKYAKIIQESSSVAHDLLENLLYWSKSQNGSISFIPEKIDIKNLIDKNILLLKHFAENKKVTLISNVKNSIIISIDRNMILTVLRNLITNAIKFSRQNDTITIDIEENEHENIIHVSDTGVGIPENIIGKLFKVDEYVKTKGTSNESGTGLGLILCKEFIIWHKGKIWVESKIDLGSKFSFSIPK